MKTMSLDELAEYERISKITKRIIGIMGVGAILLSLIFPNVFVILLTLLSLFILADASIAMDMTIDYIQLLMSSKLR